MKTHIQGFDEFMNLVLDGAVEVDVKKGTRKDIGKCGPILFTGKHSIDSEDCLSTCI